MTFKERLQMEHPEYVNEKYDSGCRCCPEHYGYEKEFKCGDMPCDECWNREMPKDETEEALNILEAHKKAYEQGLYDAWELAKRINCYENDGGLSQRELKKIFGTFDCCEIMSMPYKEALAKLKAYEEQNKIEVGDVVENIVRDKVFVGVVSNIYYDEVTVMWNDGTSGLVKRNELEKTGKHIDIKSILEQIGGRMV